MRPTEPGALGVGAHLSAAHPGSDSPASSKAPQALVEPEFAWRLSQDLPPGQLLNPDALRQAVQCHMALEIIFDRFEAGAAVDYHSRLADGLLNQAVWLGPPLPQAPERLAPGLALGGGAGRGPGVHPTGDAFAPLAWLVGFCTSAESACAQGRSLSRAR